MPVNAVVDAATFVVIKEDAVVLPLNATVDATAFRVVNKAMAPVPVKVDVEGVELVVVAEALLVDSDAVDEEGITVEVEGYGSYTANTITALVNKKTIRTYCSFITISSVSHYDLFAAISSNVILQSC